MELPAKDNTRHRRDHIYHYSLTTSTADTAGPLPLPPPLPRPRPPLPPPPALPLSTTRHPYRPNCSPSNNHERVRGLWPRAQSASPFLLRPSRADRFSTRTPSSPSTLGYAPAPPLLLLRRRLTVPIGRRGHRLARRHPIILPRARSPRERVRRQTQCPCEKVPRKEGEEERYSDRRRYTVPHSRITRKVTSPAFARVGSSSV